jgi:predicted Asp-tRNA(Asn)/Glu-tRNA(Gln) amidotransferase subunit C
MVINQEDIEKQAKQILDKFASALEKVEKETKEESYVDREEFEREQGQGEKNNNSFKKDFLENSPDHDDDFILVERGSWK